MRASNDTGRPLGLALAAALAAMGCGSGAPAGASALLITLDTTRADALGCYGGQGRTPALDRLAAEGVLYENAHTVVPLTLPAHSSMLTGLYPLRHGVRDNGVAALPEEAETLAEAAQAQGVQTAAFLASVTLAPRFGLAQGFETYAIPKRFAGGGPRPQHGAERPAWEVVDDALEWLARRDRARPFFLWVHLYDPHHPYEPPPPFDQTGDPYLGEVAAMDHQIGRLLDALRSERALEETWVLAVGDHGEAFLEHEEVTHGAYCYRTTLRVPFLLRHPDGRRAGGHSQALVSVTDVAPTLRAALGLAPALDDDGVDLLAGDPAADRGVYFESYYGYRNHGWSPLTGWLDASGKYLHSSEPLFFGPDDPEELRDVLASVDVAPHRAAISRLASRRRLAPEGVQLDEDTTAAIQALGYAGLAGTAAGLPEPLEPTDLPSPASRASFQRRHERAKNLVLEGQLEAAAELYAEILRENTRNFVALDELAVVRMKQGRTREALELLRRLVRDGPQEGRLYFNLGQCLHAAGETDEALEAFARSVELTQGRRRYVEHLAGVLRDAGREGEARELEERFDLVPGR